jgi:predicted nucleic acid binding AN1-type Zn finger protein
LTYNKQSVTMAKCTQCSKKVLVPMICKCSDTFCIQHRSPEAHRCVFDYHLEGKKTLSEQNPALKSEKISKI